METEHYLSEATGLLFERAGSRVAPCPCCGSDMEEFFHRVYDSNGEEWFGCAILLSSWTPVHPEKGSRFQILLNPRDEEMGADEAGSNVQITVQSQLDEDGRESFGVVDADKPPGSGDIESIALLRRDQVLETPIAGRVFRIVEGAHDADPAFKQKWKQARPMHG